MTTAPTPNPTPTSVWKTQTIPVSSTVTTNTPDPNAGFKGAGGSKVDPGSSLIFSMPEIERAKIAKALKKARLYKGTTNGKYSDALGAAYTEAVQRAAAQSQKLGREFSVAEYLVQEASANEGFGTGPKPIRSISAPTEAAATINSVIDSLLNREATAKEIKDFTKILNDAEMKNPSITTDGTSRGGIDRVQFLTDVIKSGKYGDKKLGKLSTIGKIAEELKTRKGEKKGLLSQSLQATAKANGVILSPTQLDTYANEINNGKDIKVIQNQIRQTAALGMPDSVKKLINEGTDLETIYSPYKDRMAAILELNPESISLNDSALRMAIGPDKEMSLYDFQRQLRKDTRWQYTNNAKEEVSNAAMKVLQDFGFQG